MTLAFYNHKNKNEKTKPIPQTRSFRKTELGNGPVSAGLLMIEKGGNTMSHSASMTALSYMMSVMILLPGCATFRSDIDGRFEAPGTKYTGAEPVSVLFVLRHIKQAKGLDAIAKLQSQNQIVRDFDNIFLDALSELSNVSNYATFTEFPSDVSQPERRAKRDTMISQYDFVFRITITKEHSFIKHFLGQVFSTLSVASLPVPYSRSYSIDVEVSDPAGKMIKNYKRKATLTMWVEVFLIFLQPFHNETIKQEQIYIEFLHDIFRQIETEKVLTKEVSISGIRTPTAVELGFDEETQPTGELNAPNIQPTSISVEHCKLPQR